MPATNDPLPAQDHVLRYIRKKDVDKSSNTINGSGFLRRAGEDAPSFNWLEYFSGPVDNQMREVRQCKRMKYEKRGKLARLNVGRTEQHLAGSAPSRAPVRFVHDLLEAAATYVADPSHAVALNVPEIGEGPEAELIGDLFLACIIETFDAPPD